MWSKRHWLDPRAHDLMHRQKLGFWRRRWLLREALVLTKTIVVERTIKRCKDKGTVIFFQQICSQLLEAEESCKMVTTAINIVSARLQAMQHESVRSTGLWGT